MKTQYYMVKTFLLSVISLFLSNIEYATRMADSEMIRCPESWQLDFQPTLKWDYCHGLELEAFMDLYAITQDKKYADYGL